MVLAIALLGGCGTLQGPRAATWNECARTAAVALLADGVQPAWPRASGLPTAGAVQVVHLGADPPEAIHDALLRTLYLSPSENAFYLHQTGGIAGMDMIHGPIALHGRCPAPENDRLARVAQNP